MRCSTGESEGGTVRSIRGVAWILLAVLGALGTDVRTAAAHDHGEALAEQLRLAQTTAQVREAIVALRAADHWPAVVVQELVPFRLRVVGAARLALRLAVERHVDRLWPGLVEFGATADLDLALRVTELAHEAKPPASYLARFLEQVVARHLGPSIEQHRDQPWSDLFDAARRLVLDARDWDAAALTGLVPLLLDGREPLRELVAWDGVRAMEDARVRDPAYPAFLLTVFRHTDSPGVRHLVIRALGRQRLDEAAIAAAIGELRRAEWLSERWVVRAFLRSHPFSPTAKAVFEGFESRPIGRDFDLMLEMLDGRRDPEALRHVVLERLRAGDPLDARILLRRLLDWSWNGRFEGAWRSLPPAPGDDALVAALRQLEMGEEDRQDGVLQVALLLAMMGHADDAQWRLLYEATERGERVQAKLIGRNVAATAPHDVRLQDLVLRCLRSEYVGTRAAALEGLDRVEDATRNAYALPALKALIEHPFALHRWASVEYLRAGGQLRQAEDHVIDLVITGAPHSRLRDVALAWLTAAGRRSEELRERFASTLARAPLAARGADHVVTLLATWERATD